MTAQERVEALLKHQRDYSWWHDAPVAVAKQHATARIETCDVCGPGFRTVATYSVNDTTMALCKTCCEACKQERQLGVLFISKLLAVALAPIPVMVALWTHYHPLASIAVVTPLVFWCLSGYPKWVDRVLEKERRRLNPLRVGEKVLPPATKE